MTSLKNETSTSRLDWTCKSVCSLLVGIEDQPQFFAAWEKILESLCGMAECEDAIRTPSVSPGSRVLVRYMSSFVAKKPLKDLGPVWSRISEVLDGGGDRPDDERLIPSAKFLHGVSDGLRTCCDRSFRELESVVKRLTCLASETNSDALHLIAVESIRILCSTDPARILSVVLRALYPYLKSEASLETIRSKAVAVLETCVSASGESLCPFVKALLPIAMSLMTDTSEECTRRANKIFSSLVRLAPLVQERQCIALASDDLSGSETVIDHLILGKPLPAITLPNVVQSSLSLAGVVLREYQQEGVAWLRFLQTMNLNGALCDSMGLGTFSSRKRKLIAWRCF
jgi:hypothetical protein